MTAVLQRFALTAAQTSLIVALQRILQATGLALVCPKCLAEGGSHVEGDVSAETPIWRLTCGCAERVMQRADLTPMDADGDLMTAAGDALRPVRLVVRCPERMCVPQPLAFTRTPDALTIQCSCAKTTLRLLPQTRH